MDKDLITLINDIQSIKQELYKKHKPELIDGTKTISVSENTNKKPSDKRSPVYDLLMKQQRELLYKKDIASRQKAEAAMIFLSDSQKEDEIKQKLSSRINFRSAKEELTDHSMELNKPWNKLSNNLKIQAILKFIESLSNNIKDDQSNQLRYLLISAVSQRKLNKISEVDYDFEKGQIKKICRLIFENGIFSLSDNIENNTFDLNDFFQLNKIESPELFKINDLTENELNLNDLTTINSENVNNNMISANSNLAKQSVNDLNTDTKQIKKKIILTKKIQ